MKILQVVPYFFPAWSYGGPAKLVRDLSLSLIEAGHEVTIYTSDAYDQAFRMPSSLKITNIKRLKIYYFRNLINYLAYKWHLFITPVAWLVAVWQLPSFEVVHLHDFFTPQNLWVGLWCRFWNIPYLVNPHGTLAVKTLQQKKLVKNLIMNIVGLPLLKNAAIVIASSDQEIADFIQLGIDRKKISLIGHGIDLSELTSQLTKTRARKKIKLPLDKTVVTYLGRLSKLKGLDLLLQVIEKTKNLPVHFVIAGSDSGYLPTIRKWLTHKKRNVTLLGVCAGQDKADLYQASDIFIYPSYSEGFSLGILEAAGAGLPLVITKGCHFNLVGKIGAGIVTDISSTSLTMAVEKLVRSSTLRKKMGIQAKNLIETKYSQPKITQQIIKLYRQALTSNN